LFGGNLGSAKFRDVCRPFLVIGREPNEVPIRRFNMGLLDSVIGGLTGQGGGSGALMNVVTGLLNQNGGVAGLLQQFQSGGLGHLVESWISTGHNLPISADQLQSVLGSEKIQQLAAGLGIQPDQLSGHLAQLLPQVIDKLTPNGSLPAGNIEQQLGGVLKGLLG
jgi:uncharacterized protein YidB (DUF937 family)